MFTNDFPKLFPTFIYPKNNHLRNYAHHINQKTSIPINVSVKDNYGNVVASGNYTTAGTYNLSFTPTSASATYSLEFHMTKASAFCFFRVDDVLVSYDDTTTVTVCKEVKEGYRYGFQGQEMDDEISGKGNMVGVLGDGVLGFGSSSIISSGLEYKINLLNRKKSFNYLGNEISTDQFLFKSAWGVAFGYGNSSLNNLMGQGKDGLKSNFGREFLLGPTQFTNYGVSAGYEKRKK